jgi:hypothetical protein
VTNEAAESPAGTTSEPASADPSADALPGPATGTRILFVHIPKTAGMSLYRALEGWATPERSIRFERGGAADEEQLRTLPPDELGRIRLMSGHLSMDHFRQRLGPGWTAITVLRDPVERALSLYSFVRGEPEHPWHARTRDRSVREFLAWYRDEPFSVNQQCLFICSRPDAEWAYRTLKGEFALACTLERLPELVDRLGDMLGQAIVLPHENASRERLDRSRVEEHVIADIETFDSADRVLYERVRRAGFVGTLADARAIARSGSPCLRVEA